MRKSLPLSLLLLQLYLEVCVVAVGVEHEKVTATSWAVVVAAVANSVEV